MSILHGLQGRSVGHPIHPLLIHFPIGAFVLLVFSDLVALAHGGTGLAADVSMLLLLIGIVSGVLASIFGLADFQSIRRDSEAKRIATEHAILNALALFIYGVSFLVRYDEAHLVSGVSFFIEMVAFLTLSFSGYLGGELVYSHGVGVGRHRRQTEMPAETIEAEASGDDYVPVCSADDIGEGESRRAEVGGTILVIVRHAGELFAFQEFCTHRQGPLSEGTYANRQVTCPWHCSSFDMKSGAVKSGPAKEPIKVFPVHVSSTGQVEVHVP